MNLTLYRDKPGKLAMLGRVKVGAVEFQTLEDIPNGEDAGEPVPAGEYVLKLHDSAKYGKVWAMVNPALGVYHQPGDIPKGKTGRFACLFAHAGNTEKDSLGCIILGMVRGTESLGRSREAVALLKETLPWVEHTLTIVNG